MKITEEQWVSVEDKLPLGDDVVNVKTDLGGVGEMRYSIVYGWHVLRDFAKVTHWLPLPNHIGNAN